MKFNVLTFFVLIIGFCSSCKPKDQNNQLAFNTNHESNYNWCQTDTTIALMHNELILWQYNFNTQKGKPFFHPININNTTITELSPKDHPWHLGLWHSWKYINEVNYWEYDESDGVKPWNYIGQTEIESIKISPNPDFSCQLELDIAYHKRDEQPILKEKRIIKISPPSKNNTFYIDYDMLLKTPNKDVTLDRAPLLNEPNGDSLGGYAGLSLRFNTDLKVSNYINTDTSNTLKHGKSQSWIYYGLKNKEDEQLGVVLFDHPMSFNYPTSWYVTNIKSIPLNYIGSAPLFNSLYHLNKGEQLTLKHRIKFYLGETNYNLIESDWGNFRK